MVELIKNRFNPARQSTAWRTTCLIGYDSWSLPTYSPHFSTCHSSLGNGSSLTSYLNPCGFTYLFFTYLNSLLILTYLTLQHCTFMYYHSCTIFMYCISLHIYSLIFFYFYCPHIIHPLSLPFDFIHPLSYLLVIFTIWVHLCNWGTPLYLVTL
jgi:hypothetical protein